MLVLSFFQTTYEAEANLAYWERETFEHADAVHLPDAAHPNHLVSKSRAKGQ